MQTPEIITLSASLCALIIVVLLIIGTILGGNLKEKVYRWFFILLMANLLGTCCEIVATCLVGAPGKPAAIIFELSDLINFIFGGLLFVSLAMYLYELLSMKVKISKMPFRIVVTINCINIVLAVAAYSGRLLGLLGNSNYDRPQTIPWLLYLLPIVIMIILVSVTMQSVKSLRKKESVSILFYFIFQIICYMIEFFFDGIWVSYLGSAIAAFVIHINIQVELKHTLIKKESELTESRVAIILTQIQPHFIHNSLLAIQDLCGRDAKEAEKAVIEFSKYLRGNLSSLTNKDNIYIEKELEHLRLYLSLEQRRFEERLLVEYDIQAKGFELPPLTLQPIVENAVLHGVTKKVEGGKITIRTRENDNHWHIIVEDTGIGFDTTHLNTNMQNHIGIQNVRYRLEAMCGGILDIQSTPGTGTTVTISIPRGGNHV